MTKTKKQQQQQQIKNTAQASLSLFSVCVRVCVCVCEREREGVGGSMCVREREKGGGGGRGVIRRQRLRPYNPPPPLSVCLLCSWPADRSEFKVMVAAAAHSDGRYALTTQNCFLIKWASTRGNQASNLWF